MRMPTRWTLVPTVVLVIVAAIVTSKEFFIWRITSQWPGLLMSDVVVQLRDVLGRVLVAFMCFYGAQRIFRFHPIFRPRYRQWLELSPWNHRLPLPLGPVLLSWQDVLMVGAVSYAAAARYRVHPFVTVAGFATAYSIAACLPMAACKRRAEPLAIIVLLPLMILDWDHLAARLIVAASCFLLAQVGLRRTLVDFPWPRAVATAKTEWLGFPVNRLGPIATANRVPPGMGVLVALLIGWWTAAMFLRIPDLALRRALVTTVNACMAIAGGLGLMRVAIYCGYYRWPLGLFGRLRTGRLIIPRFDYVFISPLVVAPLRNVDARDRNGLWLAQRADSFRVDRIEHCPGAGIGTDIRPLASDRRSSHRRYTTATAAPRIAAGMDELDRFGGNGESEVMNATKLTALTLLLAIASSCASMHPQAQPPCYVHVVVLWLKNPGNADDRQKLIDTSREFVGKIPGLVSVSAGGMLPSTRPVVDSTYDVGLVMKFDSEASLRNYPSYPVHQRTMKEVLGPLVDHYRVYDFVENKNRKGTLTRMSVPLHDKRWRSNRLIQP